MRNTARTARVGIVRVVATVAVACAAVLVSGGGAQAGGPIDWPVAPAAAAPAAAPVAGVPAGGAGVRIDWP
ncbi:hypothetical protein [Streptomyces sp. NPDC047014]|uniref:hypothetical protein n=1 Tax=Streptomyces sp. NPDC047014 TaxID=3155736 RepID=UPI00340E7995